MAKLTKKQRKFLKIIENPKERKNQKQQFKLQNKFDSGIRIVFTEGEFKTNNTGIIKMMDDFVNFDKPKLVTNTENSITKESLRDLTEPKTENSENLLKTN